MTGLLTPLRYAQVIYLTAPAGPAGGDPGRRRRCRPAEQPRVEVRDLPAARAFTPGAAAMSVWSWLKLTVCLWLLRKAVRPPAGCCWSRWPRRRVAGHGRGGRGYAAAWLRGWPPARLCRAAAWALPMTVV